MTIMLPVLIGVAGLGTEGGMLFYQHRSLQSAADAAAYSAAISILRQHQCGHYDAGASDAGASRGELWFHSSAQARIRPM